MCGPETDNSCPLIAQARFSFGVFRRTEEPGQTKYARYSSSYRLSLFPSTSTLLPSRFTMPRNARFTLPHRPMIYHIISRTALPGLPLGDIEKNRLLEIIKYFSSIYFVDVLGFCIIRMGNHWHLAVKIYPRDYATRQKIQERFVKRYGEDVHFGDQEMEKFSKKWTDLSEYVREIKQTFSRYFNNRHNRRGFFWSERFKSMIVQEGHTLVNILAYIDLNPIRAGIVKKPEDYHWCFLGYHTQTGNKDGLLSIDLGLKE